MSRRDDLESLGYTIMSLIDKEKVPWMRLGNRQAILEAKEKYLESEECLMRF